MNTTPQRYPLQIDLPSSLTEAMAAIESIGGRCRLVGGSVRDALLGLSPKDFDVEVYGVDLETIASTLGKIGKTNLVGKSFAVVKLWIKGDEFDFAIPRRESKSGSGHRGFTVDADHTMSEAEALTRRDFTINALLYDHSKKEVIDYCGGKADLENRILKHVGPAFVEDPLRVLRAMQFAGRFKMTLDSDTAELCRSMCHEFWSLPKERVWGEWEKWAGRSKSLSLGIRALESSGWIRFFPELNALIGLPQDPMWHPEGDAWTHTLCCLDALVEETDWLELESEERATLAFAVLCHDLGKARCTRWATKRGEKRWISPGHDSASIWLSEQLLQSFKAPKVYCEKVPKLVGNHHFLNTGKTQGPSDSSMRRLSNRLSPATTEELVYVMVADHRGRPPLRSEEQEKRIEIFRDRIQKLDLKTNAPNPIILGRHLIARGMPPGKHFKSILNNAYDAQLEGAFSDETAAMVWLDKELLNQ